MAPDPVATLNHPLGEIEIVKPAIDMKSSTSDAHLMSVRSCRVCMFAYRCTGYLCSMSLPHALKPRHFFLRLRH